MRTHGSGLGRHNAFWVLAVLLILASFSYSQKRTQTAKANAAPATDSAAAESSRLPVKRVVLYKNGVGYFEHSARVHGNQDLAIDFTTAQLNDVLKSLTAVDLGDGRITGVRYNSIAPLDQRLKALRLPFGEQVSREDFLSAMRGARVEVHSKTETATGRLLSVEQEERTTDSGTTYQVTDFSVITDSGEMRNFELSPAVSVRLADRDLDDEVGRYLNLIGSSRARDLRRMTISDVGSGDRNIFVSYISEVPVWKSTYRIILPEKAGEKPLLQGWAIVDNTIGEDWKDVELSLIAGAPQSFIQDISQPLYARRPVVPLPQSAMLTPQTQEATMEENGPPPAAPQTSPVAGGVGGPVSANGNFVFSAQPRAKQNGRDFDRLQQYAQLQNAPPTTEQMARIEPAAESRDLGDYFEYNIKQPITIGKNQSALVPILQARIDAEKVTLWSASDNQPPLRALWIKNSSGLTLDNGTFNIVDKGAFAGEGLIAEVHPDERRLLSYAADTAVRVTSHAEFKNQPVSRVRIVKGVMFLTREQRNKVKYTIRNSDTMARQVVIEHPLRDGWKLADDVKPEETTANYYRFRVPIDPGKTNELAVEEFHPEVTRTMLTDITQNQVDVLAAENRITPGLRDAFQRVLERKVKISDLESQIDSRQQQIDSINTDQGRIRENMKALKGSAEEKALLQRYTGELNSQEDRLAALRSQIDDLQKQKDQATADLQLTIMNVNMDQNF